jgi:phosphoribosylglycinamide formyltransferase-1
VHVLRVGVLASGSGTLFQAIADGQDERYRVAVLISDRPGIPALERAERAGIPAIVADFKGIADRDAFSEQVAKALVEHGADLVAQAGFMRILTAPYFDLVAPRPILNSHPALLPAFPGAHGVRDALAAGVKVTGATIHLVIPEVDAGPILVQEAVTVEPGDTEESLHERIKRVEQRLYPDVIRSFAR